jgi:hypothetical protein
VGLRLLTILGLLGAVLALGGSALASSPAPAYCTIPAGGADVQWAFHVGAPITAAHGTYAHGHGTIQGQRATGAICQVDRVAGSPDRQIILSAAGPVISLQHAVTFDGVLSNQLRLHVRVTSSTDPKCRVGTKGELTLIASYDSSVHHDSVQLSFPAACRRHDHNYSGRSVVVLVVT